MLRLDINLVFTIVNIVVLYICMRLFLFKPVNKILKQRQDAVQKQFDDAKEAQDKAEALKQEYEASLTNARAESDRMMEEAKKKALELLEIVGLPDKANAYPAQLSGGQQQRIAIARALATQPKVLLCDEATSALDPKTTHSILELIRDINTRLGITVIVITHQMSVVEEICNKVAILDNGEVAEEGEVSTVFAHPKSEAARRLVMPDNTKDFLPGLTGDHILRVVFNGALAAGSPLITQMAIDKGIAANILYASTRCIGDKVYGNMLLGLPSDEGVVKEATAYLSRKENVLVQEVTKDVQ